MKIAYILNTNSLGGAERSGLEQMELVQDQIELEVFVPRLGLSDTKLVNTIKEKFSHVQVSYFRFPKAFYELSRKSNPFDLFIGILSVLMIPLYLTDFKTLKKKDFLYCNGNKAAAWLILWALFSRYKGKVIWHFRDYPHNVKFLKWILALSQKQNNFQLRLVANSFSVKKVIQEELLQPNVHVVYNRTNHLEKRNSDSPIRNIGVVSMLAPWKGIHQMLLFAHMYEKELLHLGIEEFSIYCAQIYQTKGEHNNYYEQLCDLKKKFPSALVKFHFDQEPKEIFSKIDILIHPSLSPEPFGRVILEAFKSGVPVISTGLGGAAELVEHEKSGLMFFKHDHHGLFQRIEKIIKDSSMRSSMVEEAWKKSQKIENSVKPSLVNILEINIL